jgi:hypothetical protein
MRNPTILPDAAYGRMVVGTVLVTIATIMSLTDSAGQPSCIVGLGLGLGVVASAVLPVGMDVSLGRYDARRIACYYLGLTCLLMAVDLPAAAIASAMIGD